MAYLDDHPLARSQQRCPRREDPSGVVVLHSAENVPDLDPPDTGAEAVAKFIVGRSDPGSYHTICDADSRIRLVEFGCEAFQDGTGSNPHAIAVSGAFRAAQWSTLPGWWRAGVVEQMALAALEARYWLSVQGVDLPARQITREQSEARVPGFITHALRDPARRSDPGAECARLVVERYAQLIAPPPITEPVKEDDDMPPPVRIATCTDSFGRAWVVACDPSNEVYAVVGDDAPFRLDAGGVAGRIVDELAVTPGPDGTVTISGRGEGEPSYWVTVGTSDGWVPWRRIA